MPSDTAYAVSGAKAGMSKPRWVIVNAAWVVLCGVAWQVGLLDAVIHGSGIEKGLLGLLGVVFAVGQVAAWNGDLDTADRIAQLLPKLGLMCLGLEAMYFGFHADFQTAAGKAAFTQDVVLSIAPNIVAVAALAWFETLTWALGYEAPA
jgi:hypothetical protein